MDESEKLTALKKAYADIILNTAKEAAARIMVSERKATHFQQELASTKEEALGMLLRLKQMLDSKAKEAELASLSQQKKIEELEAQLQEAEEIVRDLRAELRDTQAELENVTKHQMNPPVEQNIEGKVAAREDFLQENRLDPSDGPMHSAPDLHFDSASVSDTRCPTQNGTNDGSKLCGSCNHSNNCYINNPEFASIVIRRKEPELYRNGCTQRIRAFERSHFDGNKSVSENLDTVRDETLVGVHEEGKATTVTVNGQADIVCEKEKPDELKAKKADANLVKVSVHRKKRRFRMRKTRRNRLHSCQVKEMNKESLHVLDNNDPSKVNSFMESENVAQKDLISSLAKAPTDTAATVGQPDELKVVKADANLADVLIHKKRRGLHSDQATETNKVSILSCAKDSPHLLGNNDLAKVKSSKASEKEAQMDLISPVAKATTTVEQLGSHTNIGKGGEFLKACSARNKIEDDKASLGKSDLTRQESLSAESIEVPACKDVVAADGSPDKMDPKVPNLDEKVSSPPGNDKFLKYTFRRKRKKGLVSSDDTGCSPDNCISKKVCGEKQNGHVDSQKSCTMTDDTGCSLDNCNSKRDCGEKQNGHVEPQKSCTMTESSRDSRRLAQVARQLISLSEKKWWQ